MDAGIKDKILSRARAKEWESWQPSDLSLQEVRNKFGGPSVPDEELLLRVYAGADAVKAMATAGSPREYLSAKQPLVHLIEALSKKKDCRQIFIRKADFSLTLQKRTA
jgi:oxaloacetate decarboxylase alpha subunit